jgi:branched-chain amino acid transport system ATP-binding protein
MTDAVLDARGLGKRFGGVVAADGVDLLARENAIHALIGPNGSGKTTVLRLIAGEIPAEHGTVWLDGRDLGRLAAPERARVGIGRSHQVPSLFPGFTACENVAFGIRARRRRWPGAWRTVQDDTDTEDESDALLKVAGLDARADVAAEALSHGERRQLDLAIALASRPRALLLDEPLAGLGPGESAAMIARIGALRRPELAVVLVEHDLDAVFGLADEISVLVAGRVIATGSPDEIRASADARRSYLGEDGP